MPSQFQATTTTATKTTTAGESVSYRSSDYTTKTTIDSLRHIVLAFITKCLYFIGLPFCLYGAFGHS